MVLQTHLADTAGLAEGADGSHIALVPGTELGGVVVGGGIQGDAGMDVSCGLQMVALTGGGERDKGTRKKKQQKGKEKEGKREEGGNKGNPKKRERHTKRHRQSDRQTNTYTQTRRENTKNQ